MEDNTEHHNWIQYSYQWIMLSQLQKSKFTAIFIHCFLHFSERVVRYICQRISHGLFYHTWFIICVSWTEVANSILYSRISLWLSPDLIAIGFQQSAFSVHVDIFFWTCIRCLWYIISLWILQYFALIMD